MADPAARRRALIRLRRQLHRVQARDFFPPLQREAAQRALEDLAGAEHAAGAGA